MSTPLRVVVCGDSVLSAAIADNLKTPGFQLAHITPRQPDALAQILAYQPDVALIECRPDQDRHLILDLLRVFPTMPVIQMDPLHSDLTVLAGRQIQANRVSEVVELIRRLAQEHQLASAAT